MFPLAQHFPARIDDNNGPARWCRSSGSLFLSGRVSETT